MRVRKGSAKDAFLLLVAGSERIEVRGRTAVILAELALLQEEINAIPVGRATAHFAHGKVRVECTDSHDAVRYIEDDE